MNNKHCIYIIYSEQQLDDIYDLLLSYGNDKSDIGIMRIDNEKNKNNTYRETNRLIISLNPIIYNELAEKGYHLKNNGWDFRITEYEFRSSNHPPKDCNYALYIDLQINKQNNLLLMNECKKVLEEKFDELILHNFLNKNNYTIYYPKISREINSNYSGYAIVTFNNLDNEQCTIIKLLLDQYKMKSNIIRVSWAKKSILFKNKIIIK
jgi:hypothetical protein